MSTPAPTHDNTVLLATYNHWLKKAYPLAMSSLAKLGLRVVFRTFRPNDTIINPTVMLSIVDAQDKALYSWNGQHCMGGVDAIKEMAASMWLGSPPMLEMLRARHIYMTMLGADLPQACWYEATGKDEPKPKTAANWAIGTEIEFRRTTYLMKDRGLSYLKDVYEKGAKSKLHQMVGTQAVEQITGVRPLVSTPVLATGNSRATGSEQDLVIVVGLVPNGLSFTLKDDWMELNYGWEKAGLVAVMSWQALKDTFGLEEKVFHVHYGLSGDVKNALCECLRPITVEPRLELPEGVF